MNWQKGTFLIYTLFIVLFFTACGDNYLMQKEYPLTNNQWTYADTLNFAFEIEDNKAKYNLFVDMDHSPEFANQNMYVNIYTKFPSGKRLKKMVSLEMANKAGVWYGPCGSEWCDLRIPLQFQTTFPDAGKYEITLEQFTRTEVLEGVKAVGMALEVVE